MTQTILITGASTGIGKATAQLFHDRGWNVIATMRRPAESDLAGENMLVTALDVTDGATISAAVAAGLARFGRIDALVNNAGYGACGPLEAFTSDQIKRQFDTNVIGLLEVTRAVLPHFRAQKSGVLVNVSSVGGRMTFPFFSLYHGTKFAVEGITEALAFEMSAFGGKVKIVEPGAIKTDFSTRSLDFVNDTSMLEYQPMIEKVLAGFAQAGSNPSEPSVVGEVIYTAITDGTDTLRYAAGEDAKAMMANRSALDDATITAGVRARFGL